MIEFDEIGRRWLFLGTVLCLVLVILNIFSEVGESDSTVLEMVLDSIEILLMVTGATGVGLVLDRMRAQHGEKLALIENLAVARTEGESWRRRVESQVAGIGAEINRQFDEWRLTGAEKEVGLLMLKGLSHKEIAALRTTSEATVRQQARSIYQRSNLPGKGAFSAYFLEDLLPPTDAQTAINLPPTPARAISASGFEPPDQRANV